MKKQIQQTSDNLAPEDKFEQAMKEINHRGYIESHRSGDTGIGKTLEDELGIKENSNQASDIGDVELKATRVDSQSRLTLFTKSPSKRGVNNKILRKEYGYKTDESKGLNADINILHTSVNTKDFNNLDGKPFMKLTVEGDRLYLEHAEKGILEEVYWDIAQLKKAFNKKYPANKMYHVQAKSKLKNGKEHFHYTKAQSLNDFSADKMIAGLISGDLDIDIRLGIYASGKKKGKPHDNGSAIRVPLNKPNKCFDTIKKLL